jgi:tetratricopeptide (TPR) repeat protein
MGLHFRIFMKNCSALYNNSMKTIITVLFLSITTPLFSQKISDADYVYKLINKYQDDSLQSAYVGFHKFINQKPKSVYKGTCLYYLAEIETQKNHLDSAMCLYKKVLLIDIPDSVDDNYRNKAAKQLAYTYIEKKQFKKALKYISIANHKYTYKSFCGNAYAIDDLEMASLYTQCYLPLNYLKKAIAVLAPLMFNNGLADNSDEVKQLYNIYQKIYNKAEIKNEFVNAEKTLVIKEEKMKDYIYYKPIIRIFDEEIFVPCFSFMDYEFELEKMTNEQKRDKCISTIKNSEIYKLAVQ